MQPRATKPLTKSPHLGGVALFTATIFASALLLFLVQPLYTRMVLPQIGGAAAVWTTAMLFFQTVLIGGYLYAHLLTRHLAIQAQVAVHVGVVVLAMIAVPLALPLGWRYDPAAPVVVQTLWLYALGVGLPFAALSASAPLLQSWYRHSGGPGATDPYFLYAASNLGSLIALLAFPLLIEPLFGLAATAQGWSLGFVLLAPLLGLCGLAAWRAGRALPAVATRTAPETGEGDGLRPGQILRWGFLAFVPSSLMLALTSKISTDMGAFPLVWALPLALYLLTFVLVFSARSPLTAQHLGRIFPVALVILLFFSLRSAGNLSSFVLLILAFFVTGLLAHRLLFDARPPARHLTAFYLVMSVGGALGGLFNSILAPLLFDRMIELQVTVALAAFMALAQPTRWRWRDLGLGVVLAIVALAAAVLPVPKALGDINDIKAALIVVVLIAALVALPRVRLAAVLAVALVMTVKTAAVSGKLVYQDRSFFGHHTVFNRPLMRTYTNGTTLHGAQLRDAAGQLEAGRPTPLMYYHRSGLLAQIFTAGPGGASRRIGIVGLGIGGIACHAQPGEDWHFYEIDQKVVDIAYDPRLFTYMTTCGKDASLHMGDARIVLQGQTDLQHDILLMDAYSSDALPLHLMTIEAVKLYMDRLKPDGLLIFHIWNRFYDLSVPLASIAKALGLEARIARRSRAEVAQDDTDTPSVVVVMARSVKGLGSLAEDPLWGPLPETDQRPWTDDFANVLAALRWQ